MIIHRRTDWTQNMSIQRWCVIGWLILFFSSILYSQEQKPFVVLRSADAKVFKNLCSRTGLPKFDSAWQPSEGDIRTMESRLSRISLLQEKQRNVKIEHPEQYFRQYVGIILGKRKLIYINAFCIAVTSWRQRGVNVCDGGNCFWGVLYDSETHEFSDLNVNGNA